MLEIQAALLLPHSRLEEMDAASMKTPHPNSKDKTGMVFGRLTVISRIMPARNLCYYWLCECACGNRVEVSSRNLNHKSMSVGSCGCLQRERVSAATTTHGDTASREHNIWGHIVQRCCNPDDAAYSDYGGRGITICERWKNSYTAFLEDMGRCPNGLTIDRINNDGNYEPGNCR